MMLYLVVILSTLSLISTKTVEYSLTASWYYPEHSLDGYDKKILAFNNQVPGPQIEAHVGDLLVVHVHNHFDEGLSVHWHGLYQKDQLEQDGVEGVTECPLPPGESRTYKIKIQQSGTYWYHSHSSVQYGEGLYGPLILRDHKDVDSCYDHDNEEVVVVGDWYHHKLRDLFHWFASPKSQGNEPVPDNVIINGIGQGYCKHDCDYAEFKQSEHKPTLYRFINAATFGAVTVSIDDHYFVVVEIDGDPVHPKECSVHDINEGHVKEEITHIRIDVGQRYSALVFPKEDRKKKEKSFWMRAQLDDSQFWKATGNNLSLAIVSYETDKHDPKSEETTDKILSYLPGKDTINPHSGYFRAIHKESLHVVDRTVTNYIDIDFHLDHEHVNKPYLDGRNCQLPMKTNFLALAQAGYEIPKSCLLLDYDDKDVVRLVLQNFDPDEHPIHLHGFKFWVLAQGKPNSGPYNAHHDKLNVDNPVYRDTVTLNGYSYVVIQFKADNPGIWFLHCHIDWHMNVGMGLIITVDVDDVVHRLGTTDHLKKCHLVNH